MIANSSQTSQTSTMPIPISNLDLELDYKTMNCNSLMKMNNCLNSSFLYDSQAQMNRIQANVMRELELLISLHNTGNTEKKRVDPIMKKPLCQNSDIQPLPVRSMNVRELFDDTLGRTPIRITRPENIEGKKRREQYLKRRFEATLLSSSLPYHRTTQSSTAKILKSMDGRKDLTQKDPNQANELQSHDVRTPISDEGTKKSQQFLKKRFEANMDFSSSERKTEITDVDAQQISPRKRRRYGRRNSVTAEMIMSTLSSTDFTKDV